MFGSKITWENIIKTYYTREVFALVVDKQKFRMMYPGMPYNVTINLEKSYLVLQGFLESSTWLESSYLWYMNIVIIYLQIIKFEENVIKSKTWKL